MSVDHNLMSKVHRLLRQKTDLTDRIASGPRQVRVVEKDSQVIRDSVDEAKQVVVKTKMAADEKQLHLGTREAKNRIAQAEIEHVRIEQRVQIVDRRDCRGYSSKQCSV